MELHHIQIPIDFIDNTDQQLEYIETTFEDKGFVFLSN